MATIIDLTRMLAGPYASLVLGDLGHRIIKVEERRNGDATRFNPPYRNGVSAYFFSANRNKESVILDLKTPRGREVLLDLVSRADAVIENFRPGVMEGLGLSFEELKAVNPGIVLVSITGFGSYGPLRENVSFDVVAQAMSGAMMATTPDPGEPIKPAIALGDLGAGLFCTISLMAALLRRKAGGRGTHMEVSLLDVMFALSARVGEQYLLTERGDEPAERMFPDDVFATRDGFLALSAYTDTAWQALCKQLNRNDWLRDSSLATPASRASHRDRVESTLREILLQRDTESWLDIFASARVPSAKVRQVSEVVNDVDLKQRKMVMPLDHAVAGTLDVLGNPIRRPSWRFREKVTPPPRHGEHTRRVLSEFLGYSAEDIERLIGDGVAGDLTPEPA
jgi:crotonobetainyl-CoA:carnitine CoA-transferase CaiB-like acyl-CoA transferase